MTPLPPAAGTRLGGRAVAVFIVMIERVVFGDHTVSGRFGHDDWRARLTARRQPHVVQGRRRK